MARYRDEATSSDRDESRIKLDRDEITFGRERPPPAMTLTRRRLRRFLEPGLLVAATGVILLAIQAAGGDGSPAACQTAAAPAPSPSARSAEAPSPLRASLRLVAPQTAVPGERVTVLAYRNRRLCGPAELRFDGRQTAQKLLRYAGPPNLDYAEMFMAMDVPRSAKPGSHLIELYGPRPGGAAGQLCGDAAEHQARLATTTISVESQRN